MSYRKSGTELARINLDMGVLRTFVTGFELGNFARAAKRLGRSQSVVSTQLHKLEEQIGRPLVQRSGRGLELTAAGEALFAYAKRILELNDEAVESLRGAEIDGWARLGLPQDFAESWLPAVLSRFSRAHPKVRIEVQVDRSVALTASVASGDLDIALTWTDGSEGRHAAKIADFPIHWIGRADWPGVSALADRQVPFAAFAPPCLFRSAAIEALDAAGMPWRLVFTSPSLSGLWAATESGLGITVRTAVDMPTGLVTLDSASSGLPSLPRVPLAIHRAEADPRPAVKRLSDILLEEIQADLDKLGR